MCVKEVQRWTAAISAISENELLHHFYFDFELFVAVAGREEAADKANDYKRNLNLGIFKV